MLPLNEEEQPKRVRAVKDQRGYIVGYQDPDNNNRFITRDEAIKRMTFNVEKNYVQDSFERSVGEGLFAYPLRGRVVDFVERSAKYEPLIESPYRFRPASNQEVIERVTIIKKNGQLEIVDTSYGLGIRYDPHRYGGRFRQKLSDALGVGANERLPTSDLQRAVIHKEYIVKTITTRT